MQSANSADTSCCRLRNWPWTRKGPICVGSTGSNISLRAIQLVR